MTRRHFLRRLACAGVAIAGRPLRAQGRRAPATAGGRIDSQPLASRAALPRGTLFQELPPALTGIFAENRYQDPRPGDRHDPRVWPDRIHEFAVGALGTGVAVGDYDNDGRPDLFVVSKTESCRLFRNLGGWRFEDVTERAGVGDSGDAARIWKQGACFVDIDNNGLLDLYVCRFNAPNLLYINQGDGTFREEAAARGLAIADASVMAAFCDYDRDGKLDMFLQTNLLDPAGHPNGQRDYLFHNNGDGTFTDVTDRAGIFGEAQGHSAIWWDFDGDGWPDLYVANDYAQPDQLYRNNRDGTFTNVIDEVVPHMPYSSMGADLADVDGDGRIDLLVADMAPTTHEKDQRTMAVARAAYRDPPEGAGMPQVPRNALYLNTGTGRMLEAACLAGLQATDWTWAVRWEDFDNDGRVDLLVTNGMHHEVTNADLMLRIDLAQTPEEKLRIERTSPVLKERHLAFRNRGDLRFEDVSDAWGFGRVGVAFGLAVGDFGGTGNLDVVHTNYREHPTVLRNTEAAGHRVVVALRGTRSNRFGVGATVRIDTGSAVLVRTLVLARGVLSSSEPVLHFGLGLACRIRRMVVEWTSGHRQEFRNLDVDCRYAVTEPDSPPPAVEPEPRTATLFEEVSRNLGLSVLCREPEIDETVDQPLLPWRFNRGGPAVAVGRLDPDAPEVIVLGGTARDPAQLFRLGPEGRYAPDRRIRLGDDRPVNDGPLLIFDADGDGRNDLLIAKAGNSLPAGAPEYQPRLYFNDGNGGLRPAPEGVLPPLPVSAGAVAAADFDRDGRLDVFIGARLLPGQYPATPQSALLVNRGGHFEDATDRLAPGLRTVGLVTAALWSDVDGDGWPDLLVATEWGPVRYFHNDRGRAFEDWTERAGFAAAGTGLWTSLVAADFGGKGQLDYIAGNLGLNTPYSASASAPALLYSGDFAGDGTTQIVEAYYQGGRIYPRRSRKELGASIPWILRRFRRNNDYAQATLEEIFGVDRLAAAERLAATELRSGVFRSEGGGRFRFEPLPRLAQVAPIQGLVALDGDGDGKAELVAAQNAFAPAPQIGRFDGGLGQVLRGDGRGGFVAVPPDSSGLIIPGDGKALAALALDESGLPALIATRNGAPALVFRARRGAGAERNGLRVELRGRGGNPEGVGARVAVGLRDGSRQTAEVTAGSGRWSQSSAVSFFGYPDANPPVQVEVRWPSGARTRRTLSSGERSVTIAE